MNRLPLARSDLELEELDDELVAYDRAHRQIHHLNAPAAAVWRRCDGATRFEDIAHDLATAFHADFAVVQRDVTIIVEQLDGRGLFVEQTRSSRS